MKLNEGCEEEYQRRHNAIWAELTDLLHASGISDYHIFLDRRTHVLFGTMKLADEQLLEALPQHPVMQRWWAFMKDIMETNEDHSPVSVSLQQVFYLP